MFRAAVLAAICGLFFAAASAHASEIQSTEGAGDIASHDAEFQYELAKKGKGAKYVEFKNRRGQTYWIQHIDGRYLAFTYDQMGRVETIKGRTGKEFRLAYLRDSDSKPTSVLWNGKPYTPPSLAALRGKSFAKTGNDDTITPSEEFRMALEIYQDRLQEYGRCQSCIGSYSSIFDTFGDLANWLQIGGAVGAVIGASLAILEGVSAELIVLSAELGLVGGAALVLAFAGGTVVGYFIYDMFGNMIYYNVPCYVCG
jgi:hypothetical protein